MDNYELQSDEKVLKENNVTQTKEEGVMCEVEIIEESNNFGSKQKKLFKGVGKALCNTVHKGVEVAGKMANKTAECSKIVYKDLKSGLKNILDYKLEMNSADRINARANLKNAKACHRNATANVIQSSANAISSMKEMPKMSLEISNKNKASKT